MTAASSGGTDTFVFRPGHGHDVVYGAWSTAAHVRAFYGAPEKIDLSGFGSRAPTWADIQARLTPVNAPSSHGLNADSVRLDLSDFGGGSITFWNTPLRHIDASDFIGLSVADTPQPLTLVGTAGADRLSGGPLNDRLWGLAGNDSLDGGPGADLMYGQDGNDRILGGSGHDIILSGGDGDDSLAGGPGEDYVWGMAGADTVEGGTGYDVLVGGAGNDRMVASADGATFFGQGGADLFVFSGGTSWVMDFEPGIDRGTHVAGTASPVVIEQVGGHTRIDLSDGSAIWLAWTSANDITDTDWA